MLSELFFGCDIIVWGVMLVFIEVYIFKYFRSWVYVNSMIKYIL